MILYLVKIAFSILFFLQTYHITTKLRKYEQDELRIWERIFNQMYQVQKRSLVKNEYFKDEFNQSRYNVIESPVYCEESDAYKVLHPDVLFKDMYIWKDYPRGNLQKRITTERAYAVLPNLQTIKSTNLFKKYNKKEAGLKFDKKFPLELTYIYTSVSSLYNNYHWGRGLGCTFQKYNHMPGKSSVAQKNSLIDHFMNSIKKIKETNNDQECIKNASFIPTTYRLNEMYDCIDFFKQLNSPEHQQRYEKYGPQYILKTNAHRGEGITVLFEEEIRQIKQNYSNGEKCGHNSKHIIAQRYISNPFLYKGHKIEFRIYFFIGSTKPMIAYSYKRALIKRCAKPFSVHSTDKAAHVCNTAIVKQTQGYSETDDDTIEEEEFFIDWYLEGLQDLLISQKRIKDTNWLDEYLYPRIHRNLIHMVRSTYFSFARDSRFGEFFAVDFLLDDDLDVWVLEVNYNPQILSVTPERIKRNFKMIEDTFEIQIAYIKSKYIRLVQYLHKNFYPQLKSHQNQDLWKVHFNTLVQMMDDKIDQVQISKDNLYVKIMDEGLEGPRAYSNLIQEKCLV